jgi:regulator of protease activity HflC (stomatin/prohibitin superfamily)
MCASWTCVPTPCEKRRVLCSLVAPRLAVQPQAKLASYGVENLLFAVVQLAQSAMRNEIGKISLDKTFEERDTLNHNIVRVINEASTSWGLQCLRYEIKDIAPPRSISAAMEMQAEAERRKRASILESEGEREAAINVAEGQKRKTILESEATMAETINRAKGDASAILARAEATADGVRILAAALAADGGQAAAQLRVAEQYVSAFSNLAKAGNTIILPANAGDAASMVSQALAVYRTVSTSSSGTPGGPISPGGGGGLSHGTEGGADAVQATQATPKRQPRASGAALDVSGGEDEVSNRAEGGHTRRFSLQRQ